MIAFEVQLASQTLEDFELRNARYSASGVEGVWLVAPPRYMTLTKAIAARAWRQVPQAFRFDRRPSLAHLAAVPFEVGDEKKPDPAAMCVAVFRKSAPPGPPARVSLDTFVDGILARRLQFCADQWVWDET